MIKVIRWILGKIILFIDWVFTPRSLKRSPETQMQIVQQTQMLKLYQYKACPFCVKVRRTMKRLNLPIETRDAKRQASRREELEKEGGEVKVPCLRIADENGSVKWMYESSDIINYLEQRFSPSSSTV
ncbi:Glutaredoxin [hydrothermal vent metagenome]|uniref:Glutaredoxin n=1 Tax=hydrothermal vent metagenome TaxID=652676 RepID=A0A3B1AL06_9ZZZZ